MTRWLCCAATFFVFPYPSPPGWWSWCRVQRSSRRCSCRASGSRTPWRCWWWGWRGRPRPGMEVCSAPQCTSPSGFPSPSPTHSPSTPKPEKHSSDRQVLVWGVADSNLRWLTWRMELYTNIKLMCCMLCVLRYVILLGHRSSYRGMKSHLITKERLELSYEYLMLTKLLSTSKSFCNVLFFYHCFTSSFNSTLLAVIASYVVNGTLVCLSDCGLFKKWYIKFCCYSKVNLRTHTCHQRL